MDDLHDASSLGDGGYRLPRASIVAHGEDRKRNSPLRPHPQVLETMMDELEDKVRHYFLLYIKERKRRQKCEKFSYWMQQQMAENQRLLLDSQAYVESLESKFEEIRGDPDAVRDTVQRVDLMYAQIDTLIQAFAGVCSFAATRDADKQTILQCVLDYLYPCRALDARLNALYGALYYYRLGELKGLPEQPPPPPEPQFLPLTEIMGPWIQPMAFSPNPTPTIHATKLDAGLAATMDAAKADGGATAKGSPQSVAKKAVELHKPKEPAASPNLGKAKGVEAASETRKKASLPQQADDASASVDLEGMSILLEELTGFKRPSTSKGVGIKLVARFDHESMIDSRKKAERCVVIDKCDGTPGNESASVYFLGKLSPMPPKKAGVIPKICIDVYDEKSPTGLGNAQKTLVDADTIKKSAPWQIKDTKGSVLGTISVSIAPVPLNAMLPAQVKNATAKTIGDKAVKTQAKAESKPDVPKSTSKPSGLGAKLQPPKTGNVASNSESSKPSPNFPKPELPKSTIPVSKPNFTKPASPVQKPDLPKPAGLVANPELQKLGDIGAKTELPKPTSLMKKPELPKPASTVPKPDLSKPASKPELPKPAGVGENQNLPKPGDASLKKPEPPKPSSVSAKPELPKPPSPLAKTDSPKPGSVSAKPDIAKPPSGKTEPPKVTAKDAFAKPELGKPGPPEFKPSGGKPSLAKPGAAKPGDAPALPGKQPGVPEQAKKPGLPSPVAKGEKQPGTPAVVPAKPGPDGLNKKPDGKQSAAPKPALDAKPVVKPDLGAKPVLEKPVLAKPVIAKPVLAKPVLSKPVLSKPVIPAKPMLALAKGAPGAKAGLLAKPVLSKPGLPPVKPVLTKNP